MQLTNILLPTDFSTHSEAALDLATILARDTNAKLILLHVDPPVLPGGGTGAAMAYEMLPPNTEELKEQLAQVQPSDPRVRCERHVISGTPAKTIEKFAGDHDISMVVMGTHGRRGLSRVLMGSVAEVVVRSAPCPVVTVRSETVESIEEESSTYVPPEHERNVENYLG